MDVSSKYVSCDLVSMSKVIRFILLVLFGTFYVSEIWAQEMTVQFQGIRDNTILEDETVGLELRIPTMITSGVTPDLSALEQDFFVGGRQTSYERITVNGQLSESSKLSVQLTPKRMGELKIPRLKWGSYTSDELILKVLPLGEAEKKERSQLAFMEYAIEPENVYVNSAVYIDRKFYYQPGVQLVSYMPDFPELENAIAVTIRQPSNTSVIRNGIRYNMLNDRYVVFPEKSGDLELPSQRIVLSAWRQRSSDRRVVVVNTDAQQIDVQSIPPEFPYDESWFPASDLSLKSEFEPSNLNEIMVGEAVRWTVHINAKDAYSESFPELKLNIPDQVKAFADKPQIENSICEDDLCGTATLSTTLVPSRVGTWVFPEQRVAWWNTKLGRTEYAKIPSFDLVVRPNPALASNVTQDQDTSGITTSENPSGNGLDELVPGVPAHSAPSSFFWQATTAVSTTTSIALAGVLFYLWLLRRRDQLPQTSNTKEPSSSVPKFKGLTPLQTKDTILTWLQAQYSTNKLGAIKILQDTEVGRRLLTEINQATYKDNESTIPIDDTEVQELLKSLKPNAKTQNIEVVPGFR